MAFAITNLANYTDAGFEGLPKPLNAATGGPAGASGSEADLSVGAATTTNSAIKDMGFPCKSFRAKVYLKTLAGASTMECKLQVSSVSNFATDVRTIDEKFINAVVASNNTIEWTLFGEVALAAGAQYMRVQFVTGTGTSGTADLIYYAA
jgi:hypothetical protein